jgi:hypothetical protein
MRKAVSYEGGRIILEGTLALQEAARPSPRDVLWIRLPLASGAVDLYGHIDSDSLAFAEVRFRTEPQKLPEVATAALLANAVVVFPRCQYEVIPLLSSPCDLYSLAVIMIRTVLVNDRSTLAAALDDILSLARQVAHEQPKNQPLPRRIQTIFDQKPAWLESLGPHRLTMDSLSPQEGITLLPKELWFEVLAVIVRCLTGSGPDAYCADLGDAPALALESIFDRPLADLENLLTKTRSLIVIDWSFNREVRAAIAAATDRLAPKGG